MSDRVIVLKKRTPEDMAAYFTLQTAEMQVRNRELEAENARLHQEWAIAEGKASGEMPSDTVLDEVLRLKAENTRLREAAKGLHRFFKEGMVSISTSMTVADYSAYRHAWFRLDEVLAGKEGG